MMHRRKLRKSLASYSLRGRCGSYKLRVLLFKLCKSHHEHVVIIIGYDRRIVNIVQPVVIFNFLAELFDLFFCVHAQFSMFRYVFGTLPTITVSATITSVTVVALSVPHGISTSMSIVTSSTS